MTNLEATAQVPMKLNSATLLTPRQTDAVVSFFVHDVVGNIVAVILLAVAAGTWRRCVKQWRNRAADSTPTPPE
ncbi:hypothetical protein ACGFMM_34460 [Streptomyces sp. NPDC048604]|uniref:hypothetical protein n=1 Tax=Streptomyces sp. NPDC048604 TaxID=3365578 RepID=UPI003714AAE2